LAWTLARQESQSVGEGWYIVSQGCKKLLIHLAHGGFGTLLNVMSFDG
jgi:hypothetical protein